MSKKRIPAFKFMTLLTVLYCFGYSPPSGCAELAWPIRDELVIRGTYGDLRMACWESDSARFHKGVDLHAEAGTDIYPVVDEMLVSEFIYSD